MEPNRAGAPEWAPSFVGGVTGHDKSLVRSLLMKKKASSNKLRYFKVRPSNVLFAIDGTELLDNL